MRDVAKMLADNNVRSATAWLRAVAREGELLERLEAARPAPDPYAWAEARAESRLDLCEECWQPPEFHAASCSLKEPRLCANGCGQIVKLGDLARGRPCKVCGHVNTFKDAS